MLGIAALVARLARGRGAPPLLWIVATAGPVGRVRRPGAAGLGARHRRALGGGWVPLLVIGAAVGALLALALRVVPALARAWRLVAPRLRRRARDRAASRPARASARPARARHVRPARAGPRSTRVASSPVCHRRCVARHSRTKRSTHPDQARAARTAPRPPPGGRAGRRCRRHPSPPPVAARHRRRRRRDPRRDRRRGRRTPKTRRHRRERRRARRRHPREQRRARRSRRADHRHRVRRPAVPDLRRGRRGRRCRR